MTDFSYRFPISGVETNVFLPPAVAFIISFFTSMAGMSGAFLILPFQMSVLGFTSPSVSATNFVYNIVSIPSGAYRYFKEGRMAWPLVTAIVLGTIPGVLAGYMIRVIYLPDPRSFKIFVGWVLLFLGIKMLYEALCVRSQGISAGHRGTGEGIRWISSSIRRAEFELWGERFSYLPSSLFALSLVVGMIGGVYGIGGGAIIAPFMIAVLRLPVYAVAGAALMATMIASAAGVLIYSLVPSPTGINAVPDWLLGALFGLGGFAGMYLGARTQKHVPERIMKFVLGLLIIGLGGDYIIG